MSRTPQWSSKSSEIINAPCLAFIASSLEFGI
jgi:hypothetical protein